KWDRHVLGWSAGVKGVSSAAAARTPWFCSTHATTRPTRRKVPLWWNVLDRGGAERGPRDEKYQSRGTFCPATGRRHRGIWGSAGVRLEHGVGEAGHDLAVGVAEVVGGAHHEGEVCDGVHPEGGA